MKMTTEKVRDLSRSAEVLNRVIEQALAASAPAQINIPRGDGHTIAGISRSDRRPQQAG